MQSSPEELAYEEALRELQAGNPRHGIWVKALAHSDGEEAKARAAYLRFRAEQILTETHAARREAFVAKGREVAGKAASGTMKFMGSLMLSAIVIFGAIMLMVLLVKFVAFLVI